MHDLAAIDRRQFARVVENLLSNSRKYSRDGQAQIEIQLSEHRGQPREDSAADGGDWLQIRWQDHGRGVEPEQLPKLFESFYRTDAARSGVAKGSGLGLAIVQKILAAHGGHIHAENVAGGGLAIVMDLPILEQPAAEKGEPSVETNPDH